MANKRCKTCKYWDVRCRRFDMNGNGPLAQINCDADDGSYDIYLNTDPEFGCVCWEGRTK